VTNSPKPAPVVLEPEPSSVKFLAPVPAVVTPPASLTSVPDYVPGRGLSTSADIPAQAHADQA
jgi:hypothetical protein